MHMIQSFILGVVTIALIFIMLACARLKTLDDKFEMLIESYDNYSGLLLKRISDLEDLKNEL